MLDRRGSGELYGTFFLSYNSSVTNGFTAWRRIHLSVKDHELRPPLEPTGGDPWVHIHLIELKIRIRMYYSKILNFEYLRRQPIHVLDQFVVEEWWPSLDGIRHF